MNHQIIFSPEWYNDSINAMIISTRSKKNNIRPVPLFISKRSTTNPSPSIDRKRSTATAMSTIAMQKKIHADVLLLFMRKGKCFISLCLLRILFYICCIFICSQKSIWESNWRSYVLSSFVKEGWCRSTGGFKDGSTLVHKSPSLRFLPLRKGDKYFF